MIGTKFDKPLQDDNIYNPETGEKKENPAHNTYKKYSECAYWCNANDAHIEDKGEYYEVVKNVPYIPTPTEKLQQEADEVRRKLSELDYIGTKIATGRSTREEYAEEIALMTEYANRLNEIEDELKAIEN